MAKISTDHKKNFIEKFLEFQKKGLQQYGKYLDQQLKLADKMKYGKAYKTYIEQQIILNDKRMKNIDNKVKKL